MHELMQQGKSVSFKSLSQELESNVGPLVQSVLSPEQVRLVAPVPSPSWNLPCLDKRFCVLVLDL